MRKPIDLSVYLVTNSELSLGRPVTQIVQNAVDGGATVVQLREKELDTRAFFELAKALKELLSPAGIPLIINDRMDIALAAKADGIHVGQSDMPVEIVRTYMGEETIIGLSVESLEDALAANELDIDYIGISPVYTTPTKAELTSGLGLEGVKEITDACKFPSVGIGGIYAGNAGEIIKSGADGVAVVSAICSADDPEAATRSLVEQVDSAKRQRGTL